jgi:asparagine synthetase B (glutamine-hydrolysing)
VTDPPRLNALEIASGHVYGLEQATLSPPGADGDADPRRAFEDAVREALRRPPCIVTFSGGRDSSIALAVAVEVARREGLEPPIPLTYRFPACRPSDESEWQERVIAHLGLIDWLRPSFDEELDCLGAVARAGLARHGLLWPANIHFIVPALRIAGSGSVVTGHGGDEILDPGRHAHLAAVLARQERPTPRDVARLVLAGAPRPISARRRRREATFIDCPWLRAGAIDQLVDAYARVAAAEPVRRPAWVQWLWRLRSIQLALQSMAALASDTGTQLVHPFLAEGFVASYGSWAAAAVPSSRTHAIRSLFGDLLPDEVASRRTKATFDGAFWGAASRTFASSLLIDDVDSELVDGRRAIAFWAEGGTPTSGPIPSATLLQATWLRRDPGLTERGEERGAGLGDRFPVTAAPELETR